MSTKIFVGNLPAGVTSEDIQVLFLQYGTVTECVVLGSFGFVHMAREIEARQAVAALNRFDLYGSELRVEMSTPSTQGKMKSGEGPTAVKIFVGNLATGTSDMQVQEIFEPYGHVTEAVVIGGYGFVHMSNTAEAKTAIADLNGFKLNGQPITVELSTKDTQGKSKSGNGAVQQFERPRGGAALGGFRGRGRGMASTRFDPYSAHGGSSGGGSWMGRGDPYGGGPATDLYVQNDPYRHAMLHAPPPASVRAHSSLGAVAAAGSASGGGDDASFARDLLKLYSENPVAFDAYARDPVVRRSMKLDGQESVMSAAGYDDVGMTGVRELYPEPRLVTTRMVNSPMAPAYGSGLMTASRRGGAMASSGLRPVGPLMGYHRPNNQSHLFMSFE